jgi:SAM-dependent methyltransferase
MDSTISGNPFEEFAEQYDAWFDGDDRLIFDIEVKGFKQIVDLLPQPWVEIGVGSGRFAEALGIKMGLEPSNRLREMAGKRGIKVIKARGEDRVFEPGAFGTVFLIATLCFVDSPQDVLERAWEILSDDGRLVLGLMLKGSPWTRYYLEKKRRGHPFYSVARFFSYDELLTLLRDSRFSIERAVSVLFQQPEHVERSETPVEGLSADAGFNIIVANKLHPDTKSS